MFDIETIGTIEHMHRFLIFGMRSQFPQRLSGFATSSFFRLGEEL